MIGQLLTAADALILDWDGTTADTTLANYRTLADVLDDYQVSLSYDWYLRHVGLSLPDTLALIRAEHRRLPPTDLLIHRCRDLRRATINDLMIVPATAQLLDRARQYRIPCAIASGTTRSLVDASIAALGLSRSFTAVITIEDVARGKPAPDLYLSAAARLGVAPARCLAVDDAAAGVAAILVAGMRCLTLRGGHLVSVEESQ
jgi:HAD superfamily hydrolase (TIGR01509 family)